ncbi:hypothetical protein C8J55DRAFT_551024 [Lentinula edodes]|uniref:Uncharacterized protein n=1 Tax=Lentinula lateritia TaxID=40482 RepID=A0A9W9A0I2_9AGAR|nr:hypothetical protein C8J55DRAFT_551024 [Lentinula edodes]
MSKLFVFFNFFAGLRNPRDGFDILKSSSFVLGRHETLDARGILSSMPFIGKTKLAVTVTIPVPEAAKRRINSLIKAFLKVYRLLSNFEIEMNDEADSSQKSGSAKFKHFFDNGGDTPKTSSQISKSTLSIHKTGCYASPFAVTRRTQKFIEKLVHKLQLLSYKDFWTSSLLIIIGNVYVDTLKTYLHRDENHSSKRPARRVGVFRATALAVVPGPACYSFSGCAPPLFSAFFFWFHDHTLAKMQKCQVLSQDGGFTELQIPSKRSQDLLLNIGESYTRWTPKNAQIPSNILVDVIPSSLLRVVVVKIGNHLSILKYFNHRSIRDVESSINQVALASDASFHPSLSLVLYL